MQVIWTRTAVNDLIELRAFISQVNPNAAQSVAQRILEIVDSLRTTPEAGRQGRISGTREMVITKTPFQLPYRIKNRKIELLRALHGKRLWPEKL